MYMAVLIVSVAFILSSAYHTFPEGYHLKRRNIKHLRLRTEAAQRQRTIFNMMRDAKARRLINPRYLNKLSRLL